MKKLICHLVDRTTENHLGIDQYIAEQFGWSPAKGNRGMNPAKIAALRGLYDQNALETHTSPLIDDNVVNPTKEQLDEAYKKLQNFRKAIKLKQDIRINNSKKHLDKAYDILRHAFSLDERSQRVHLISDLFSTEVDRLTCLSNNISRKAVVEGFRTVDGNVYGGPHAIFSAIFNNLLQDRQSYYEASLNSEACWKSLSDKVKEGNRVGSTHPEWRNLLDFKDAPTNALEYKAMCESRFNAISNVLENWDALIPFVLKDLVKKEGLKIGKSKAFVSETSTDNFGENDIKEKWDMSEAVRDGWQRNNDLESAESSIGQQVRRAISTIYEVEQYPEFKIVNGKRIFMGIKTRPVLDAMGFRVYKNPTQVHQFLSDYFRGVQNSEDMMKRLIKPGTDEAVIPWLQPLVDIFTGYGLPQKEKNKAQQLVTQFFVDFKKNFQPYSISFEDTKEGFSGIKKLKTVIINKRKNLIADRYKESMSPRGVHPANVKVWGYTSVFEEGKKGGKINWERLAELRKTVLSWVVEERVELPGIFGQENQKQYNVSPSWLTDSRKNTVININGKPERLTYDRKREFLMEVFTSLGYDVTIDTIDSILNSKDIYNVRIELEFLFNPNGKLSGLIYILGNQRKNFEKMSNPNISSEEKKKALEELNKKYPTFKRLYNSSKGYNSNGTEIKPFKEHSEKLLDIISTYQEGKRVESQTRYMDNTMYSNVNPSFLGDRLEAIQSFVDKNDREGLLNYLQDKYLQSYYFVSDNYLSSNGDQGKIYNMWLEEIVKACKNKNIRLADSVASIFTYERNLGSTDKKFEEFTSKEHAIDLLIHFFADEKQNKGYEGKSKKDINRKLSALYPVFTLGDAGVSKFIRAPRISSAKKVDHNGNIISEEDSKTAVEKVEYQFDENAKDKIVDKFWDIYIQEKRRMAADEAMTFDLYANGKKVKHIKGEFSILTFLNSTSQEYISDYYIPDGSIQGETDLSYNEQKVKEVIRKYLDNASLNNIKRADGSIIESFKQRLQDLGVLETIKDYRGKVHYKFLDSLCKPENLDSKIAEFYWNTKLATAQQLQIMTIDPSFYHGSKDLQKRYKEVHAPGTELDLLARDFSGNLYSQDGIERCVYFKDLKVNAETSNPEFMETILRVFAKPDADVESAIAEGILIPKEGTEETVRQNKLVDLLGEENYKGVYRAYTKNTLTDGQGYRSLTSYRKVMGMAGKWTQDMENFYNEVMEIRNKHKDGSELTDSELQRIDSFALTLQPIKPYMFTHEKINVKIQKVDSKGNKMVDAQGQPIMIDSVQYIPVQHKYAEALIIPELMPKGSKLRDLGMWMEENGIDLVGSDKIAKVGCFGQSDLSNTLDTSTLKEALSKGYVHKLSYQDYKMQSNVPEHINSSQLFGTQLRKLIMAGLNKDNFYNYLEGQEVNLSTDGEHNTACKLVGSNLLAFYNSLICANIDDSYNTFKQNISDIKKVSELLQQSTISFDRVSMDNLFSYVTTGNEKALEEFVIPLFEGGLEHDSSSLLLSTFKKIVNKQQISGGSAVQVSAFGINGYEESGNLRYVQDPNNKSNILYSEVEIPFDKTVMIDTTDKDGNKIKTKVALSYDKYCFNDGNMKPSGSPIEKGSKGWSKYQSYTYKEVDGKLVPCNYNDPDAKVYKPLIEEDYPDILSFIAYRIPSESDYSLLNCRVKRFSSKVAGGTIKVPAQGTTIAGFDFDIDKLYFMFRDYQQKVNEGSYIESKFEEVDKIAIWNAIYSDNPKLEVALRNARAKAERENPDLVKTRTLKSGRTFTIQTPLNSYYDAINGEQITGKSKAELFREKAVSMGKTPTKNLVEGERISSLDTYDFTKTPEQNSRSSRNNMLITLIQERLTDPETAKSRYTPGGFEGAKKAARFMRELKFGDLAGVINDNGDVNLSTLQDRQDDATDPEPNYDVTDPYTLLVYNQQNQVAAKLIGIFANQNAHNAFVSCLDKFELKEAIDFCGHTDMKDLLHKDSKEVAQEVSHNLAQFLAASVDAVKDPVLNFMNLNTITADAACLLARLGYNMEEIGLFFNQPIIVDACQEAFNSGRNINSVIVDLQNTLKKKYHGVSSTNITSNSLAYSIIDERKSKELGESHEDFLKRSASSQLAVLDLFEKALKASRDISDFVLSTKFTASNAVGSTFGALYSQQLKVDNYLNRFTEGTSGKEGISYTMSVSNTANNTGFMNKPIDNNKKLLTMNRQEYLRHVRFNPFAYEQAMYDTNRKALKDLAKYFPYETSLYTSVRNKLQGLCKYGVLSEDEINSIHCNIVVALLSKQQNSEFHGEALHMLQDSDGTYKKGSITNREYYREHFAADLSDAISEDPEGLGSLEIFKFMIPKSDEVITGKDPKTGLDVKKEIHTMKIQDVGGLNSDTKEAIKESWAYLMEVDDNGYFKNPKYAEIGKDLFMYCFYQMGFEFSPISFMHLAPTAVKDNIIVERAQSLPLNEFNEGDINWEDPNSNDVLVWSATTSGSMERLAADFDLDRSMMDELQGKTFRLPDSLSSQSIRYLVEAAKSHPELRFKIDMDLTQEQFNLFSKSSLGMDVPANIYFSKGTVNKVLQESKDAISYGKNRTYRQFLNEILNGKSDELTLDDFAKQWILNNLNNPKFVFDLNKCNKTLRTALNNQAKKSLSINKEYIDIDLSSLDSQDSRNKEEGSSLDSFVRLKTANGMIISASWCPCILYNGSYYMADSGDAENFNVNKSLSMRYTKVTPLGTLKSLQYDYGKVITPSVRYQSYLGESNEDLNNAEFIYSEKNRVDNSSEDTEGIEDINDESMTNKNNRDTSAVTEAFNNIKQYAEENGLGEFLNWDSKIDELLNLDFGENLENLSFDDVYDSIDEIMAGRVWRRCSTEQKEALVSAVFDYNKNPTYINTESEINEDPNVSESSTLPSSVREYLETQIANEFIAATEKKNGTKMMQEDIKNLKEALHNNYSDKDIIDTVEDLKKACRENGVLMLDDEGNLMKGC